MKILSRIVTVAAMMLLFVGTSVAQNFGYGTGGQSTEATHNVTTIVEPWCYIALEGGNETLVIHTLDDGAAVFEEGTVLHYGTNDPDPTTVNVGWDRTTDRGFHLDLRVEGKNLQPHSELAGPFLVHYPTASAGTLTGNVPLAYGSGGALIEDIRSGGGTVDLEYRLWEYFFGAPGEDVTEVTYTMTADCGDECPVQEF